MLNGTKVFLMLLALAGCWTVLSSLLRLAYGSGESTDFAQLIGAVVVVWITVSVLARMRKRQSS